jgi:lysophospholipase L1-like esterase
MTVLVGANDACTLREEEMTPVADFGAQFAATLAALRTNAPTTRVYVLSIPDVYQLWEQLRDNPQAVLVWNSFDICQSMLQRPRSMAPADQARRERVRQRIVDYNAQLAAVCVTDAHCHYDGDAVFTSALQRSDISSFDYFHLSLTGQARLAATAWQAANLD